MMEFRASLQCFKVWVSELRISSMSMKPWLNVICHGSPDPSKLPAQIVAIPLAIVKAFATSLGVGPSEGIFC